MDIYTSMDIYGTGFACWETGLDMVCKTGLSYCETGFSAPSQTGFDETGFQRNRFSCLCPANRFGYRFPVRFAATVQSWGRAKVGDKAALNSGV